MVGLHLRQIIGIDPLGPLAPFFAVEHLTHANRLIAMLLKVLRQSHTTWNRLTEIRLQIVHRLSSVASP